MKILESENKVILHDMGDYWEDENGNKFTRGKYETIEDAKDESNV